MAPLAKPMVRKPHDAVSLARSSSLEGSTIGDQLRSEVHGRDSWVGGTRRDGGTGQVGHGTRSSHPSLCLTAQASSEQQYC